MKTILKTTALIAWVSAMILLNVSCDKDLDIKSDYSFDWETMPVQSKIMQNETVEIRSQLTREGYFEDAKFYIRFFQTSGKGELKTEEGTVLVPNDSYALTLTNERFNIYYTSQCTDQQAFDVYITDNFGRVVQRSFAFQDEKVPEVEPEKPIDYGFTFTTLPVVSSVLIDDTVEIRASLSVVDERNDATYFVRYFQTSGSGKLLLGDVLMQPNELYDLDRGDFRLYYVSNSTERQAVDVYIVDSQGNVVQRTFSFENIPVVPEAEIDYSFTFETLPVPKAVASGDVVEIRCTIQKADARNDAAYFIRYFQLDGKGELALSNGTVLVPNDLYALDNMEFRLYYTSHDVVQQGFDVYIVDSRGNVVQKSFSFQGIKDEAPEDSGTGSDDKDDLEDEDDLDDEDDTGSEGDDDDDSEVELDEGDEGA
jgi:hypothetical protein